jgi:peptide deformylase
MKLIVDKLKNGLPNPEFEKFLKTPVEKSELNQLESDVLRLTLSAALKAIGGYGIAANQLGINKRACIIKYNDTELFLLNPVITERSDDSFLFYEGCLSIPSTNHTKVKTIRSTKVVVQTDNLGELTFEIDPESDREKMTEDTIKTVVVQHEIDHLDGITVKDRVYSTTIVKQTTFGRNDKIVLKSETGELIEVKYKKAHEYMLKGYQLV